MIVENSKNTIGLSYKRRRNGMRNYQVVGMGEFNGVMGCYIDEISVSRTFSIKDGASEALKIFIEKVNRQTKKGGKNGRQRQSS